MSMRPSQVRSSLSLACALGALLLSGRSQAEEFKAVGSVELGLFGGAHFFATDNELGTAEEPGSVPSIKQGGLVGVRLAVAPWSFLSLEGELLGIPTTERESGQRVQVLGYRGHVLFHVLQAGRFRPFLLAGFGAHQSFTGRTGPLDLQDDVDPAPHYGAGFKVDLSPRFSLRADFRHLFPPSIAGRQVTNDFEGHAGIAFRFGGGAEPVTVAPPAADTDGDGIDDPSDRCPSVAEDRDGFEDSDGCPDPDNDGDGVPDAVDRCVSQPESRNGVDDADGCPEDDLDGDGVVGTQDVCPQATEDKDGFEDEDGCPDLDNDRDGIPDAADKCPSEPETRNGFEDEDGCVDTLPPLVQRFTGAISGLTFVVGSAALHPDSTPVIDEAAKVLREYPAVRMEISGHTSSEGAEKKNQKLSLARAESVKQALVDRGIEESRITTQGYGSLRPIAVNSTKAGRAQNRRIEFRVINGDPAPRR